MSASSGRTYSYVHPGCLTHLGCLSLSYTCWNRLFFGPPVSFFSPEPRLLQSMEADEGRSIGEGSGRRPPSSYKEELPTTSWTHVFRPEGFSVDGADSFRVYVSGKLPSASEDGQKPPILLLIHGGGHTGLSWTLAVKDMVKLMPSCCVLAPDLRGHGQTSTRNDDDLSMPRLVDDLLALLRWAIGPISNEMTASGGTTRPRLILLGHSLGGAVAIRAASDPRLASLVDIGGLVVVDMVEGSAMASLEYMRKSLQSIPRRFDTVEQAIQWSTGHGVIKNIESARISVPGQLRPEEVDGVVTGYTWRTDLLMSERFWQDWFLGLSNLFLEATCPRLLVLATWDRIDTTLMKGQMAGKFEVQIIYGSNHACHEDFPGEFARIIFRFMCRNGFSDEAQLNALQSRLAKARAEYRHRGSSSSSSSTSSSRDHSPETIPVVSSPARS